MESIYNYILIIFFESLIKAFNQTVFKAEFVLKQV